ncbi:dihydropteridine reductase [Ramicandelaber brevisporus]|nr:dihydropteridine reductase [Ramicandelaber brevisporus]
MSSPAAIQRVIIYGGSGALGSSVVKFFAAKSWNVISIDMRASPTTAGVTSIVLNDKEFPSTEATGQYLVSEVGEALGDGQKADAVICVAGGFAMGNAASFDMLRNSQFMIDNSINTSLLASHVAAKHLKENGLLVLTGAASALGPTPALLGYGLSKAAVHHLTASLAAEGSGLPTGAKVAAILPTMLDTPANRDAMPGADKSSWTPLDEIAAKLHEWAGKPQDVKNAGLYRIITKDGSTSFQL